MSSILTVRFADGDIIEQLHMLKVSALTNRDLPALWRLTEQLMELALATSRTAHRDRWPAGYVTDSRLFDVPVDLVQQMPHLLCEDYVVYPYTVSPPHIVRPH
jgi:hypothetical protein